MSDKLDSEALMRAIARTLQSQFGRGFSYSNVKRMRQFYLTYPQGSPAMVDQKGATVSRQFTSESTRFPSAMSWSHYRLLMLIDAEPVRSFYEIEAVQGRPVSARTRAPDRLNTLRTTGQELGRGLGQSLVEPEG